MQLTNNELTSLVHGFIYNAQKDDGYNLYYRCLPEQINHLEKVDKFLYDRSFFQASVTVEFETNATDIRFDYKIFNVGALDSFDIYINGEPYQFISLVSDIKQDTINVRLPEGHKCVTIYLPCDAETGIKNFNINGNWESIPNKKETFLCYGDSITHGYGSLKASITYINTLKRELNCEVLNLGIGGYWFDENYVLPMNDLKPDKILVALGTNQLWSTDKYERIDKFFLKLQKVYPNIPIIVITPIWRGDREGTDELIIDMKQYLIKTTEKYSNINVIDGSILVPHIEYYFLDNLHPNGLGMDVYGRNLVKKIKELNL